jgi:hypothetical protein
LHHFAQAVNADPSVVATLALIYDNLLLFRLT